MAYRNNMKLGWIGFAYPAPSDITEDMAKVEWQMKKAKDFGCEVLQPIIRNLPREGKDLDQLKEWLKEYHIEYEMQCPREVFELAGDDAKSARETLIEEIKYAKELGSTIMRCGYGRLCLETSRYNKKPGMTGKEQFDRILASLKEAKSIFEEYDMKYAQENHVDFTGKELANLFEEVNSPNMGIALDTANSFAVFCEPNLDVQRMAPWAITSHIKDTKVVPKTQDGNYFPFITVGCALGEGNVDIPAAIEAICTKARYPDGFHLVVEQGWFGNQVHGDPIEYSHSVLEKSLIYLKKLVTVK